MSHMAVEIIGREAGYQVDTNEGTFYVPQDVHGSYIVGNESFEARRAAVAPFIPSVEVIVSIEVVTGYFGRLSAPGYLDATDWTFETNKRRLERQLKRELRGDS